jgi:hypothetical protein
MPSIKIIRKIIKKEDVIHGKTVFLFDIPIYRCSEKAWETQTAKDKKAYFSNLGIPKNTHAYEIMEQHCKKFWRYDEIVGWLKISARGSKVFDKPEYCFYALLFFSNTRVQKNQARKKFVMFNCHEQISVLISDSDSIFCVIKKFIDTISKRSYESIYPRKSSVNLSRYFLDKKQIESLGPRVNWRSLVKSTLTEQG